MDLVRVLKLGHQLRKGLRLNISREHGVVDHGQRFGTKFKELTNLARAVLKPDDLSGAFRGSPKK